MQKNTRKIKKKPKVFIDASIFEYRYFDSLKIMLTRKYRKIITSKKEIQKLHKMLDTVKAIEFFIVRNIKWLLEQFSKNPKFKITEENKNTKYCIKHKICAITMNTKFATKIRIKSGQVELLTNKLQKVKRKAAVIDTCGYGGKDIDDIVKDYKTIYIPSTILKERFGSKNKKWVNIDMVPVWMKENPFLIPDDNILIFCSENNLDLITADKEMAMKAFIHGINCRLLGHIFVNADESNNIHKLGTIPKITPISPTVKVSTVKEKDTSNQIAERMQITGFSKEKVSSRMGMLMFSSKVTYDEMIYIIKNNGTIVLKTTGEVKIEQGDIIKHFMQKTVLNQIFCKVSKVKNKEGVLDTVQSFFVENSNEAIDNSLEFSEEEKKLIKRKYIF